MAPQELFLGVPLESKNAILETGYTARRGVIRTSKTPQEAVRAFERCHSRVPVALSLEPPADVSLSETADGVYIHCAHLPAEALHDATAAGDVEDSSEMQIGDAFWAVEQSLAEEILRSGFQTRHRRSIPVALSPHEAEGSFKQRRGLEAPCAVLRVQADLARARGFHIFSYSKGLSMHGPRQLNPFKITASFLERAPTPRAPQAEDAEEVPLQGEREDGFEPASDSGEEGGRVGDAEFPRMKQGTTMWVHLCAGRGSDQRRWVQGRIVRGGEKRQEVRVQVKKGNLGIPENISLDDGRVLDFHHPDVCQFPEMQVVQDAEVQALHGALRGGAFTRELKNVFGKFQSPETFKVGSTLLQKCFVVPDGQLPVNGQADFFKRLEASLKAPLPPEAPAECDEEVRRPSVATRKREVVRCFAVFECQADPPCPAGDSHLVVKSLDGGSDPRLGDYHMWDACNGKDVFKKYGADMYLYMAHGKDLKIGTLLFDIKDYTHCDAPVLQARGVELYLYHEWDSNPYPHGQGRWILAPEVMTWPLETVLEMTDAFAMSEIQQPASWPPWPENMSRLRFNEQRKDAIEELLSDDRSSLDSWPFIQVRHGDYLWAFGPKPDGQEHVDTVRGNGNGDIPLRGWHGVYIEWPEARRFASSVVMARPHGSSFRSLQNISKLPSKGCLGRSSTCHKQSEAIFIELFDPCNPEHLLLGEHKYRECPECFRLGDRCSKIDTMADGKVTTQARSCSDSGSRAEDWMRGRQFRPTEGGLETTVTFENIQVQVFCYPDTLAFERSVWELGQEAVNGHSNNRSLFNTALTLLNDRILKGEPQSLAHVLLLLNNVTCPPKTGLMQQKTKAGVHAAASAEVFEIFKEALDFDKERQGQHLRQKNAIAELLQDQAGFSPEPKTGHPEGWVMFPLRDGASHDADLCFHGTSMTALAPILLQGLKKPQSKADVAHGQARSTSKRTIYLSPSWWYSAHPVYSPLHVVKDSHGRGTPRAFQLVLKCGVRKGEYTVQDGTLASKHWDPELRMDPDRPSMDGMEYLVEDEGAISLTEVMFREFGRGADAAVYGELPPKLDVRDEKLEYQWTKMLQKHFRACGWFLTRSP